MNFIQAKDYIKEKFEMYGFTDKVGRKEVNTDILVVGLFNSGSRIELAFPGIKSAIGVHDFRVDLYTPYNNRRQSLSHVNLLVDIKSKCSRNPSMISYIRNTICHIYEHGLSDTFYPFNGGGIPIDIKLIREVHKIHSTILFNGKPKKYHAFLNELSLSYEDLFNVIFWVLLQEDINYPAPAGGRGFPFKLYMEFLDNFSDDGIEALRLVIPKILEH